MFFRNLVIWGLGVPITFILFPFALAGHLVDRSGNAVHRVGTLWMRIALLLSGVRVEVNGLENIPSGPVILVANHKGAFDIPALQVSLPLQFRWVAKKGLFKIPLVGWAMSMAGYIPIDTHAGRAFLKSIRATVEKIRGGTSILVFPEGTRNPRPGLLPFKRGVFLLAEKSGAPIVPIAIKGTESIMKIGSLVIRPGNVRVSIGPPIEPAGLKEKDLQEATRRAIEKELEGI